MWRASREAGPLETPRKEASVWPSVVTVATWELRGRAARGGHSSVSQRAWLAAAGGCGGQALGPARNPTQWTVEAHLSWTHPCVPLSSFGASFFSVHNTPLFSFQSLSSSLYSHRHPNPASYPPPFWAHFAFLWVFLVLIPCEMTFPPHRRAALCSLPGI